MNQYFSPDTQFQSLFINAALTTTTPKDPAYSKGKFLIPKQGPKYAGFRNMAG